MRKLLIAFLLLSSACFGQSKKEQIEALNQSLDSLELVLTTTRDNSVNEIGELNATIQGLNFVVNQLKSDVSKLESSTSKLTKDNDKLKLDLAELSMINLSLEEELKAIEVETSQYKTVKIGNLEVMTKDLDGEKSWNDAKRACTALGEGWRLPTKEELNVLYQNKDTIDGFVDGGTFYWSSTSSTEGETEYGYAWMQNFSSGRTSGEQYGWPKGGTGYMRAVREL